MYQLKLTMCFEFGGIVVTYKIIFDTKERMWISGRADGTGPTMNNTFLLAAEEECTNAALLDKEGDKSF